MKKLRSLAYYVFRVLIALDQFGNALLGGRPDHTISGRVGYYALKNKQWALNAERVINTLFFWDKDHCRRSIEWDEVVKPLRGHE